MSLRKRIAKRKFTDERVVILLKRLAGSKSPFWRAVAERLSSPRRKRPQVNVSKINRYAKEGEKVVVPGKVLGSGNIEKKVIVGAYAFSAAAREKIEKAGGKALSIEEMLKKYPEGKELKIVM